MAVDCWQHQTSGLCRQFSQSHTTVKIFYLSSSLTLFWMKLTKLTNVCNMTKSKTWYKVYIYIWIFKPKAFKLYSACLEEKRKISWSIFSINEVYKIDTQSWLRMHFAAYFKLWQTYIPKTSDLETFKEAKHLLPL